MWLLLWSNSSGNLFPLFLSDLRDASEFCCFISPTSATLVFCSSVTCLCRTGCSFIWHKSPEVQQRQKLREMGLQKRTCGTPRWPWAAKRPNSLLSCIGKTAATRLREGILPSPQPWWAQIWSAAFCWAPQYKRLIGVLERIQQVGTKMIKRLEHWSDVERLWELGLSLQACDLDTIRKSSLEAPSHKTCAFIIRIKSEQIV